MASTDVFDMFEATPYDFLLLSSGTGGNRIVDDYSTTGIVKVRDGLAQSDIGDAYTSNTTLHMRPNEGFIATVGGHLGLVGHGVRIDGDTYRIEGVTVGKDYDTGLVSHYYCTLKKEAIWQSSSPLV